jgi:hypothetical protein
VHAGDAGGPGDAGDDAADEVAVQRAAVVGDQPLVPADVLEVDGGPGGEQVYELGVQRDVAVVAERDAQPVPGADLDDCVGVQAQRRGRGSCRSARASCSAQEANVSMRPRLDSCGRTFTDVACRLTRIHE